MSGKEHFSLNNVTTRPTSQNERRKKNYIRLDRKSLPRFTMVPPVAVSPLIKVKTHIISPGNTFGFISYTIARKNLQTNLYVKLLMTC